MREIKRFQSIPEKHYHQLPLHCQGHGVSVSICLNCCHGTQAERFINYLALLCKISYILSAPGDNTCLLKLHIFMSHKNSHGYISEEKQTVFFHFSGSLWARQADSWLSGSVGSWLVEDLMTFTYLKHVC